MIITGSKKLRSIEGSSAQCLSETKRCRDEGPKANNSGGVQ